MKPVTMERARALAMACELHQLLGEIYDKAGDRGDSRLERAWDAMDDVVELLDDEESLRFLQLSEQRPSRLSALVLGRTATDGPSRAASPLDCLISD
jgi:hypothetical protein